MENNKDANYLKLLKDLRDCYGNNVDRLEIPFPCLKDYPVDMPNKLMETGFLVDFTKDSLIILLKTQLVDSNKL